MDQNPSENKETYCHSEIKKFSEDDYCLKIDIGLSKSTIEMKGAIFCKCIVEEQRISKFENMIKSLGAKSCCRIPPTIPIAANSPKIRNSICQSGIKSKNKCKLY